MDNRQGFDKKTEYVSVPVASLKGGSREITFDVFIQVSENNWSQAFSKQTAIDYQRLAQLISKGVKEVFIRKEDEPLYRIYVDRAPVKVLNDPDAPQEKKIGILLNIAEQSMAEVFAQVQIPAETVENTKKIVRQFHHVLAGNPKTFAAMLRLASQADYLYYHSVACAIFGMLLAKATGLFDRRMIEIIGLGGLLHDIGETLLPEETISSSAELTPSQWRDVRTHTKLGLSMIENTPNIPDEVRYIVYQHHEAPSGQGYPNGLKGNAIFYPAKIIGLVDGFVALISRRPYRPAFTPDQALHILNSEKGKYEPQLVRLLGQIFLKDGKTRVSNAA